MLTAKDLIMYESAAINVIKRCSEVMREFRDDIVLDDFDTYLKQLDWTDKTGYRFTIREHPLIPTAKRGGDTIDRCRERLIKCISAAPSAAFLTETKTDEGRRVQTMIVVTGTYSIGD